MISEGMKALEKKLIERDDMVFPEAATDEDILEFEKNNNITLPQSFKEWLHLHDGGEFYLPGGVQIYGVVHKPLIDVAYDDRPSKNKENYVVIGAMSTGDPILCEKAGESISIYNHEEDTIESDEVYPNFFAFIDGLYSLLGIED